MTESQELEAIIIDLLNEPLSSDRRMRLEELLSHEEHRKFYEDYLDLHAQLTFKFAEEPAAQVEVIEEKKHYSFVWRLVAIAAIVAIALFVSETPHAEITARREAHLQSSIFKKNY